MLQVLAGSEVMGRSTRGAPLILGPEKSRASGRLAQKKKGKKKKNEDAGHRSSGVAQVLALSLRRPSHILPFEIGAVATQMAGGLRYIARYPTDREDCRRSGAGNSLQGSLSCAMRSHRFSGHSWPSPWMLAWLDRRRWRIQRMSCDTNCIIN